MAVLIALALIQAFVGWAIGHGKGRGVAGFFLGLGLGVIGWIIAAVLKPSHEELVRRESAHRAAAQEVDRLIARQAEGLDELTSTQVQHMTGAERRAYVKTGAVPAH